MKIVAFVLAAYDFGNKNVGDVANVLRNLVRMFPDPLLLLGRGGDYTDYADAVLLHHDGDSDECAFCAFAVLGAVFTNRIAARLNDDFFLAGFDYVLQESC